MCFWRSPQYDHPCILVGAVVDGSPVAEYNRRVIRVPLNSYSVEVGTYGGVRTGGGKIYDVQWLGRVTVPLEDHLWIVQQWVGEALHGTKGGLTETAIQKLKASIDKITAPPSGVEATQLDLFRAVIVNRMEDDVFIYRKPSSFP
jgi:hypothetical protein